MGNVLLTKFKKANQQLEKGNVIAFGKSLIDIYAILTCNCFFRDQKEVDYHQQLELLGSFNGDENDFYVNIAKGFVYLRIEDDENAFKYLTKAIALDGFCDLPYSLRASIKPEINVLYLKDAKTAVQLNPSARNFFVLAGVYAKGTDKTSIKKSIVNFGKVIKIRPDCACAYANRAVKLRQDKDLICAVNDWIKCIEIDKNHRAYFPLWSCLNELERFDEALKYCELGAKAHPDNIFYQYALGVANAKLEKYENAIKHYKRYLEANPQENGIKNIIIIYEKIITIEILIKAEKVYNEGDFIRAKALFEDYFATENNISENDLKIYLLSVLKINNPDISIDETNPIYYRLNALKTSYTEKVKNGGKLIEDEINANKLLMYLSNYTIGFGIYEGENLSSIISNDPEYVLWCIINLDHFSINKILFTNPKFKNEPLFPLAIEHNLIKEKILEKWKTAEDEYKNCYHNESYDDDNEYDRETFDALTDGQYGDYDDFEGDIDDVMTWLGK